MGIQSRIEFDPVFPASKVERSIRDCLSDQARVHEALKPRPNSACEPVIDSLCVVEIICAIEKDLGIELPTTFVPRGGYDGVEACVGDLLSKAESVWSDRVMNKEEQHESSFSRVHA